MKTGKRLGWFLAVLFLGAAAAGAQQITRIAVVDLGKIIASYSRDSAALKAFEQRKAQVQAEVTALSDEIKRLQAQKLEFDKAGDRASSLRVEGEVARKTEYLRDFVRVRQAELDEQARRLGSSDQFVQAVYRQIQGIAETEGFSLVLNLKSADSVMSAVVWYSPMIDITDKVIQALIGKAQ